MTAGGSSGGSAKPSAIVVSHLLDSVPTEAHVFSSLTSRLPIYVVTTSNKRLWSIEGSSIRLVGPAPAS